MIVADCVVRSEPVLAHALLTAPVETRGEQAAIVALQPVIGGCLPTGQTARFTKDSLRGVLAHTAYGLRVALAASAP